MQIVEKIFRYSAALFFLATALMSLLAIFVIVSQWTGVYQVPLGA